MGIGTTTPTTGLQVTASSQIINPKPLFERRDEANGCTNLAGASKVVVFGNLLAIAGAIDNAVTLVDMANPSSPVKRADLFNVEATRVELGTRTAATGKYSTALGLETVASGDYSTALGSGHWPVGGTRP